MRWREWKAERCVCVCVHSIMIDVKCLVPAFSLLLLFYRPLSRKQNISSLAFSCFQKSKLWWKCTNNAKGCLLSLSQTSCFQESEQFFAVCTGEKKKDKTISHNSSESLLSSNLIASAAERNGTVREREEGQSSMEWFKALWVKWR